jgi:hypothetical protein
MGNYLASIPYLFKYFITIAGVMTPTELKLDLLRVNLNKTVFTDKIPTPPGFSKNHYKTHVEPFV